VEQTVWVNWEVEYRDVQILDSQNRVYAVFNLTRNDLAIESNREILKQMFLAAAKIVDSDKDRLPDDWELRYFNKLSGNPADDPDSDGADNFTEFAFGTNPNDAKSRSSFQPRLVRNGQQSLLTVPFRRRAGGGINYIAEVSADFKNWTRSSTEITAASIKLLFDGTGTSQATYSLKKPAEAQPYSFVRIRALPAVQ